ncbi:MAG: lysophospholipid acyltransferase family protein [Planctomycetota bacterium]|jgi:1-acyl-sn-glycerol-3-phosphate acyltransferase
MIDEPSPNPVIDIRTGPSPEPGREDPPVDRAAMHVVAPSRNGKAVEAAGPSPAGEAAVNAPKAAEIEHRFSSAPVVMTRPLIMGGIRMLRTARRFGWSAEGLETLREIEPPVVFAANHLSHSDTAAILGTLPRCLRSRTAVAAALDVFGPSSKGRSFRNEALQLLVAAGFHAFAFDRHGPPLRSIRTSVDLIRHGWSLLLYPEGTRSRSGAMGPFKAGVGVLARFTRRPVVPVYVEGGQDVLPHGVLMPRPGRIVVRYGQPLTYRDGESPDAFVTRLREQVGAMCEGREAPLAAGGRTAAAHG